MGDGQLFPATLMPDRDWWQALWPDPAQVLVAMGIVSGMAVIDLGCGDGYFTAPMANLVGTGKVTGFDLNPQMLTQAQANCAGLPTVKWIAGDAMALSRLVPGQVDYVLMANTFHGVPDKTGLAREARSVLKPGGRFGVINWYPLAREETTVLGLPRGPVTPMRLSPEATRQSIEPAGFRFGGQVELPPYHYGAWFVRE